ERTLKLLTHLPSFGVDAEVLTPLDPKWLADDPASLARVPSGLRVHRIPFRGPSNRQLPGDRLAAARSAAERLRLRAALAPRRLDACVCVDYAEEEVRRLAPGVPVTVVENGVDLDEIQAVAPRRDPAKLTFVHAGYFFGDRGPDVLLHAVSAVVARRPELRDV